MAVTPGGSGSAPVPNPANIVYGTYVAAGIVFAKATDENIATAKTTNASANSLTDVFSPVTLATGKITSALTNSIVVSGTSTAFLTDFTAGDYLFYYTADASPILLGRIASVDSDTQITLTAFSPVAISATPGAYCGKTNTVIGSSEQILIRIPVVPLSGTDIANSTQIWMPNWNAYRNTSQPSSNNLTSSSSMETYSEINNPTQETGSPVNVPYTITPIWEYTRLTATNGYQYVFASSAFFPNYVYALLNPYGNSTVDNLAANTLYKMFANETFFNNGIVASTNYPVLFLQTAGY